MEWFDEFCGFSGRPQGCCASLRDNALDPAHQIRKQKSYSISKQMLRFGVEPGSHTKEYKALETQILDVAERGYQRFLKRIEDGHKPSLDAFMLDK